MTYPRPSSANRWVRCPASEVLPHATTEESPQASRGSVIHRFLSDARTLGRDAALEKVPAEHLPYCELVDLADLPVDPDMFAAELKVCWKPADHNEGGYEGTADVAAVDLERRAGFVGDYKTGRGFQPPAAEHWQLRSYALLLAKAYDLTSVTTQLIRLDEDGKPWRSTFVLGETELAQTETSLRLAWDWIEKLRAMQEAGKPLPVAMGPHCRYCPAYNYCPGQIGLATALATRPESVAMEVTSYLTPERAGVAVRKFQQAKALVEALGEALRAYAIEHDGIDLGDGTVYGPTERQHTSIDAGLAFDALANLYGPGVATMAVRPSTSMAAIEKAVKAELGSDLQRRGTWKAAKEELLATLEKAGAVVVTTRTEVREHRR